MPLSEHALIFGNGKFVALHPFLSIRHGEIFPMLNGVSIKVSVDYINQRIDDHEHLCDLHSFLGFARKSICISSMLQIMTSTDSVQSIG